MRTKPRWGFFALSLVATGPAVFLRLAEVLGTPHISLTPPLAALIFGLAVLGAAFLLSIGAELAQQGVSQALALALVALVAVLPEYALDYVFAWKAGAEAAAGIPFTEQRWVFLAVANMTGANRLLVGLGWPIVILLHFFRERRSLRLGEDVSLEVFFLGLATLWAFTIFLVGAITIVHTIGFVGLFVVYIWLSSRGEVREVEMAGPAVLISQLSRKKRYVVVTSLFVVPALVILVSAEPFASNLVDSGAAFGVDEFILAQWIGPLASEAPELTLAVIFVLRGNAAAAMVTLVASKVNQWTLLVGTLPLVYSFSLGDLAALPLDGRQNEEVLLTAGQSLLALALLARLVVGWRAAVALLLLFATQLFSPLYPSIPGLLPDPENRHLYSLIYVTLTGLILLGQPNRIRHLGRLGPRVIMLARRSK